MSADPNKEADRRSLAPAADWASGGQARTLVLLVATASGVYLCYRLALPFLPALAWSVALAVLFTPLQRRLEGRIRSRSLAALASIGTIVLIVVIPAGFVAQSLVVQVAKGGELVASKVKSGEWRSVFEGQATLASLANRIEREVDLPGTAETVVAWLSATAGSLVKGSVLQLVGFVLTFYLLFFFLRDRHAALQGLRRILPLRQAETDRLFARVDDTIHATLYGTLLVSSVQGLLGGLMFWWLGLSAPLLWGVVMALLAVVPVLGAFVVWIPAALFLLLEGSWAKALVLVVWGILVVGTIDNLLRPALVGNRLKLHTVVVFISIVGGLMLFGTAGLILGPVVLAVTAVLLEAWSDRYAHTANGLAEGVQSLIPGPEPGIAASAAGDLASAENAQQSGSSAQASPSDRSRPMS